MGRTIVATDKHYTLGHIFLFHFMSAHRNLWQYVEKYAIYRLLVLSINFLTIIKLYPLFMECKLLVIAWIALFEQHCKYEKRGDTIHFMIHLTSKMCTGVAHVQVCFVQTY